MRRTFIEQLDAKRVLTGLGIVVTLFVVGRWGLSHIFSSGEAHAARERVQRVLDGMKPGGNLQEAICLWYQGTRTVSGGQEQFNQAADAFERWQREREIATVGVYEITESRVVAETGRLAEATVLVKGTIDGKPFAMLVRHGEPIAWAQ